MPFTGHVQFWIRGQPVGTPLPDRGVGSPICIGCQQPLDTGFVFHGNGAVCRTCMDELRNELWLHMGHELSRRP